MREHGKQRVFTDPYLKALKPSSSPFKLSEYAPKGEGRLIVRVLPSGVKEFFYRYRPEGRDATLALGRYDPRGVNGKTLAAIRTELRKQRGIQVQTGDVKAHIKAESHRKEVARRRGSLAQLLAAYVANLERSGKVSAERVRAIFRRNVEQPFPLIAQKAAGDVEPGDVQMILARMVRAGIKRQTNVTRAYLRAAFAYGMAADHDPRTAAADGVLFGLKGIPVASKPIREFENARNRVLTPEELKEYWLALESLPVAQRATLRVNLGLACQRSIQLLRAEWPDFDFSEKTLLLRDAKGRGGVRDHLLPLTTFILEHLKPLRQRNADNAPPFSTNGTDRISDTTLSHAVLEISRKLKKSKGIPEFQARDLRRTAETMLQKLGIDKEVRAHLLSHGRTTGVQGKHYERYDFLDEKRQALEKWTRHLERIISGKAAKVVNLKGAA